MGNHKEHKEHKGPRFRDGEASCRRKPTTRLLPPICPSRAARAFPFFVFFVFFVVAKSCVAFAASAPLLLTWQLDPYAQATENVISAIERVTPTADGGLVVDVGFNREPSEAPTIQFVYSTKGSAGATSGGAITQVVDGESCSYPEQSMALEGRWVYAYTLPATPVAIDPTRLVSVRRCRFGGLSYSGRKLEGGGYAILEGENIYMGRSGTFTIGGRSFTFEGGVLLEPNAPAAEAATASVAPYSLRARAVTPPNTPTRINGKPMAFPVRLKQEATE